VLRVVLPSTRDFTFHVQAVTDLHRLLEDDVADSAQSDDPVGIEREQADGEGEDEEPVRDLLAETAAGGPVGIDVLWVSVTGEVGELENVRLTDGAGRGGEAIAGGQLAERAAEEISGGRSQSGGGGRVGESGRVAR
jgi:hypothetical protein